MKVKCRILSLLNSRFIVNLLKKRKSHWKVIEKKNTPSTAIIGIVIGTLVVIMMGRDE